MLETRYLFTSFAISKRDCFKVLLPCYGDFTPSLRLKISLLNDYCGPRASIITIPSYLYNNSMR